MERLALQAETLLGGPVGGAVAILIVGEDGVAQGGRVGADLVGAALMGGEGDEAEGEVSRRAGSGGEDPVGRDRFEAAVFLDADGAASSGPFGQVAVDAAGTASVRVKTAIIKDPSLKEKALGDVNLREIADRLQ